MYKQITIVGNDKPDLILLTEVIPKAQKLLIGVSRISITGYQLFTLIFLTWVKVVAEELPFM